MLNGVVLKTVSMRMKTVREWCENGATDSTDVVVTKMVSNLTITVVITNTDKGINQQDVSKQEQ